MSKSSMETIRKAVCDKTGHRIEPRAAGDLMLCKQCGMSLEEIRGEEKKRRAAA
jgi:predicted RNA-binding Zn-ribbon protein involved in translation (DUF1610 family)